MKKPRLSIAGMMLLVALASPGLAPPADPSDAWPAPLAHGKVGLVVAATFLARFGLAGQRGWWFGIATFGSANVILTSSGFLDGPGPLNVLGLNLSNMSFYLGRAMLGVRTHQAPIGRSALDLRTFHGVVSFRLAMTAASAGGLLVVAVERRRDHKSRPPG